MLPCTPRTLVALLLLVGSPSLGRAQRSLLTPVEISGRPGEGVTFAFGDAFSLTVRGRAMLRYTFMQQAESYLQELTVRRARLYLAGHTFSKDIQYYFHAAFAAQDFEPDSRNPLYDVYVQLVRLRDLHVRIGQQLVPFNRARVISSQNAELVDRSIVSAELNLDRDVGIKLYSTDLLGLGHRLGYEIFVGTGNGRNQQLGSMGLLYVLRLQVNPMGRFEDYSESDLEREARPRLSVGIAAAYNQDAVRQHGTTGTFYRAGFDMVHATCDLLFKWAGFALQAEWILRYATAASHTVTDEKMEPLVEHARSAHGVFVQAGYVLPIKLGFAARYSQLFTLGETDPALTSQIADQGHELAGAVSYFLHGHVLKVQADYAYLFGVDVTSGHHQVRVQMHVGY